MRLAFCLVPRRCASAEAGFAFAEKEVADCLSHEVLTGEPKEDTDRIDEFAHVSDRVGKRRCAEYFDDVVFVFGADLHTQLGQKLAAVIHQLDIDEGDRAFDCIVLSDIRELFLARRSSVGAEGHEMNLFPDDLRPVFFRLLIPK